MSAAEVDAIVDGITPADAAKARDGVTAELGKEATAKALVDEVKDLSATTIQIDKDFYNVSVAFGQVDNAGFNFPRKLQPEWDAIRKEWTQLLWDSREAATRTYSKLDTLEKVIIPTVLKLLDEDSDDYVENVARARGVLIRYAEGESPVKDIATSSDGGGYAQAFKNLQEKILKFKDSFDGFTKKEQANVEAQINSIKGQINSISAEIRNCEATAARLGRALGLTIFGTIVGAGISLFAFGILGPCIAFKVLVVGTMFAIGQKKALIDAQRRSQELQGQLRAKEAELKNLQDKLALLKKCEALLEAQKSVIGDIASRMANFTVIWAHIRSNAFELAQKLADAKDETDYDAIKAYLNLLQASNTPLMQGLKEYATQIDKSGVKR